MLRSLLPAVLTTLALAAPPYPAAPAEDGPHVVWKGDQARVLTYRDGRREERDLPAPWRLEAAGTVHTLAPEAPGPAQADFPAPERIAAVSDVHGHLDNLARLLAAQGILDAAGHWAFGTGHLVINGDVCDKGPQVTQLLWFIRGLESQAAAAGGRVHLVLGNHEAMTLRGNHRSLHPAYRNQGLSPQELLGPDTELGRWLRAKPVLLKLGDTLFVHAGVAPALLKAELPLAACNARFRRVLDAPGKDLLLTKQGPIWYRGLLSRGGAAEASPEEVQAILDAFGVARIVVGHVVLGEVKAFHGGRVFGIDADMEAGRPGELWLLTGGRPWRGLPDGRRLPL
ncbi:metallophosphoesterase [Mesoterricola sediminis]|uniref:Calcineurin-like phosphoesterase domain-containing protein n=1 Tax=Mesoterricola sediminis TaxID=2927980 RepID=A0AA48GTW0_9BACT|nr:metallophosphoesterase [Mesoterricola sediminis]BDU77664.1 hypothetical protein METESE_26220 [Mesoterricola sediminis]